MARNGVINGTFTSESVCSGHPDKIADQISDAILDAVLSQDPYGHVAVETLVTQNQTVLAGEIRARAKIDPIAIAQEQIKRLGYTDSFYNFSDKSPVVSYIHAQSSEIAVGVDQDGAGDQGMMYGYATRETQAYLPTAIAIAHALARAIDEARESRTLSYLRPDGKTQVTLRYSKGKPVAVERVIVAVPHSEEISIDQVKHDIYTQIGTAILHTFGFQITEDQLLLNGTGVWHHGGPAADTGVTGRKIVVDSYGGYSRVGGGAFSGKDPTKVDRSGAYYARFVAKNLVAHGLMDVAEVRLAYAIGSKHPVALDVEDFGTLHAPAKILKSFLHTIAEKSVSQVIEDLELRTTKYLPTAAYGHFGRDEFPWEHIINV